MSTRFPDSVPALGDVLAVTYPCGMITEVMVRQRTITPDGQIRVSLWMSHHDSGSYGRNLYLADNTWFTTRLDNDTAFLPVTLETIG